MRSDGIIAVTSIAAAYSHPSVSYSPKRQIFTKTYVVSACAIFVDYQGALIGSGKIVRQNASAHTFVRYCSLR